MDGIVEISSSSRVFFSHPWGKSVVDHGGPLFPVIDNPGWTIPHRRAESARARRCAHRDPVDAEGHARGVTFHHCERASEETARTAFISVGNNLIFMLRHGE